LCPGVTRPAARIVGSEEAIMRSNRRLLASMSVLAALAGAGLIEAIRLGRAGLAVLLGLAVLVAIGAVVTLRQRTVVSLRADLAVWVTRTTAATGETPERLVDRAVSAYRAELDGERTTTAEAVRDG
jgi:hypothetical protein